MKDVKIIYSKEVYLGKNDSAENWHEIAGAEYKKIKEEQIE